MEFSPDYFKLAVILSLSGLAALILIFLFEYKNGKIIKRLLSKTKDESNISLSDKTADEN